MPAPAKIHDRDLFEFLWRRGDTIEDIAVVFRVRAQTVSEAAARFGLAPRSGPRKNPAKAEPETDEAKPITTPLDPRPDFPPERDVALIKVDGGYQQIAALAAEWNLTILAVMARWHRLRAALGRSRAT